MGSDDTTETGGRGRRISIRDFGKPPAPGATLSAPTGRIMADPARAFRQQSAEPPSSQDQSLFADDGAKRSPATEAELLDLVNLLTAELSARRTAVPIEDAAQASKDDSGELCGPTERPD